MKSGKRLVAGKSAVGINSNRPRKIGWQTIRLLINIVSPSPDRLPQRDSRSKNIQEKQQCNACAPAICIRAEYASKESTVPHPPTLPDCDNFLRMRAKIIKMIHNKQYACPNHRRDKRP